MNPESQMEPAKPFTRAGQPIEDSDPSVDRAPPQQNSDRPATVIVRGEAVRDAGKPTTDTRKSTAKKVSEEKVEMQSQLPALDDDGDVGVEKEYLVMRDDKPDLRFTGRLLASAAPDAATDGEWEEYRIYDTTGGKHVFSKVTRSIYAGEQDQHEADVFEPNPSSVPSQLLRSARDLTRSRPVDWTDAAVGFFGYNLLAKTLYRKLGTQFDERIS